MNRKGFTLLETLVSVVVFLLALLSVYFLFNQGQWTYLTGEKRSIIQQNARLLTWALENDFRMIGSGVPKGYSVDPSMTSKWVPAIFTAGSTQIGFCSDLDGGNTILASDVGTGGNDRIYVDDAKYYEQATSGGSSVPAIVVSADRKWDSVTVDGVTDTNPFPYLKTDSSVLSPSTFKAENGSVSTVESVSYRFVGDNNGDGICDAATTAPYVPTNCVIQRAQFDAADPDHVVPSENDWSTFASDVYSFRIRYFNLAGTELATFPLSATDREAVARIIVSITTRSRAHGAGEFQDVHMQSEILIRKKSLQ